MAFAIVPRARGWRAVVVTTFVFLVAVCAAPPAAAQGAAVGDVATEARDDCRKGLSGLKGLFRPLMRASCYITQRLRKAPASSTVVAAAEAPAGDGAGEQPLRDGCIPPPGADGAVAVPDLVSEIFRCRLRDAGWADDNVTRVAAEAVVVADCESKFDPDAVVFSGRYRDVPHPNGNRYSAAGVFQFIRASADIWIDGGYDRVHDPARNIDGAARLYLHNVASGRQGWADWACAGVNDGFAKASVLPGWPGGPAELPAWAFDH